LENRAGAVYLPGVIRLLLFLPAVALAGNSLSNPGFEDWSNDSAPSGMSGPARVLIDDAFFGITFEQDTYKLWFAQDSIADRLVDYFGRAQASIDYCCYNSTRPDVVQALLDARGRGVEVRVITEDSRLDDPWVAQLRSAGIPVWSDSIGPNSSWLMHNKFAVRDARDADTTDDRVWAASYNPNDGELRADFALELPMPGLARAYTTEFEQMWGGSGMTPRPESSEFHNGKTDRLATHRFELDGYPVRVYFSPQNRPVDTVAALVSRAQKHVLFGVLTLTHDGVGDAMVERWQHSVWVGGVIDRSGINNQGSEYPKLIGVGIPVYEDSVPFGEKMIHEKLGVIDSSLVICGSVNWSGNGNENNDEHMLVIEHPTIARKFLAELSQRFWEATHPGIEESRRESREQRAVRGPSLARSFEHLPKGAVVMDAAGRVTERRNGLAPGVYFVFTDLGHDPISENGNGSCPASGYVPRRVVIVR